MFLKVLGSGENPDQSTLRNSNFGLAVSHCTSVDFTQSMTVAKGIKCRFLITVVSLKNISCSSSSLWQVYIDFSNFY